MSRSWVFSASPSFVGFGVSFLHSLFSVCGAPQSYCHWQSLELHQAAISPRGIADRTDPGSSNTTIHHDQSPLAFDLRKSLRNPEHHRNVITCSWAHQQPFLNIHYSFSSYFANSRTNTRTPAVNSSLGVIHLFRPQKNLVSFGGLKTELCLQNFAVLE